MWHHHLPSLSIWNCSFSQSLLVVVVRRNCRCTSSPLFVVLTPPLFILLVFFCNVSNSSGLTIYITYLIQIDNIYNTYRLTIRMDKIVDLDLLWIVNLWITPGGAKILKPRGHYKKIISILSITKILTNKCNHHTQAPNEQ